jgi:cellulose synthase operon protein YhjQ
MSVIGVVSMKGGVGKTSLTANLAAAMASVLGPNRVSVVDLDPQNALHLHCGVDDTNSPGVCRQSLANANWHAMALPSAYDVLCMPYGMASESERKAFETLLHTQPDWIGVQIAASGLGRDSVVLIDTPPGPSVYLKQVFACADLVIVVVLADAGSYATIPAMESWVANMAHGHATAPCVYLVNQVDKSEVLNRDVVDLLSVKLGARMAPIGIHADESVREALAFQQPVLAYAPHGQASHDVARLADWLIDGLST